MQCQLEDNTKAYLIPNLPLPQLPSSPIVLNKLLITLTEPDDSTLNPNFNQMSACQ